MLNTNGKKISVEMNQSKKLKKVQIKFKYTNNIFFITMLQSKKKVNKLFYKIKNSTMLAEDFSYFFFWFLNQYLRIFKKKKTTKALFLINFESRKINTFVKKKSKMYLFIGFMPSKTTVVSFICLE